MQQIKTVLEKQGLAAGLPMTTPVGQTEYSGRTQATDLINKVFRSLKAIFPAWSAAIRDPEIESQARQEWLRGFIENGITSDTQINFGLAKCRAHNSPFLPSVGQFIAWCDESCGPLENFPSEGEVKLAIKNMLRINAAFRRWETCSPVVYWIYGQIGSYQLSQMTVKETDFAVSDIYSVALKMAKGGHVFQPYIPPERQVESLPEELDELAMAKAKAEGEAAMSRIMDFFGGNSL